MATAAPTAEERTKARDRARKLYPPPLGPCEDGCGRPAVDRHHDDYSKPDEIVRLCRDCHLGRHPEFVKTSTVSIIVTDVPARMRRAIVSDARSRDVSVNEAAVAPLCQAYGVKREPSGVRFVDVSQQETMTLRVPNALRRKLRARAAREDDATIAGLVRACWAAHYGLPEESPARRPRS